MIVKEYLEKQYRMPFKALLSYVCDLHGELLDFNDPNTQRKMEFIEKTLSGKQK